MLLGLISIVLVLAVIGFVVYLITTYIPMPAPFAQVIVVVVVIVCVLWVLSLLMGHSVVPFKVP
jgi:hypothetical protein